jgi:tRNA (cmo5U34)-methyltransferase
MKDPKKDTIFSTNMQQVPNFVFDASVASVFTDMISRSVPGYATVIAISGLLAERFSQPNTRLYDLGCSLGATTLAMAQKAASGCEIIAVDNSQSMLDGLRALLVKKELPNANAIRLICSDIQQATIDNASVVALNYTLQFIAREQRSELLQKIFNGMTTGGVLILSEKIALPDADVDKLFIDLHHEFKRSNGYSDLEISQKRDAIEDVLLPESLELHMQRLQACGFKKVEVWFQCFNFASLIAFK